MTPNSSYQFLQAFFNELLGRYAHLQQFVERTRLETGIKSPKLLEVYSRQLESRINELLDKAEDLWRASFASIDPGHLIDVFHYLVRQSDKFQQLHRTLRWFSAPWPEAEVFEFLGQVFEERGLQRSFQLMNPSIVFSDEYNFLTYDVGYVQKGVSRSELTAWAIPKSESTNPLLWSVLVHEVAHSLFKEPSLFNYISRSFSSDPVKEPMDLIRRWAVELNADLFGFRALGPAYLCSLVYLSMFFVSANLHRPLQRKDSRSFHPPPSTRVELLFREAPSRTLINGSFPGQLPSSLSVFEELFNERLAFDTLDGFEASDYQDLLLSDETLDRLWRTLKEFQREHCPYLIPFSTDFSSASQLSAHMEDGILAGSLPINLDHQLINQFIHKAPAITREAALSTLNERPASMFDIMNAGWMNKVDGHAWRMPVFEELRKEQDRISYLPHLLDALTEPARQLQMSIQVALVLFDIV
jgi:hypothetical protein